MAEGKRPIGGSYDKCMEAAKALKRAFVWRETDEGYDYWLEVYNKIIAIGRTLLAPPCEKCPAEEWTKKKKG